LYDLQSDPEQMNNLLGDIPLGTASGGFFQSIPAGPIKELVRDLTARRNRILQETGGRPEPRWSR
jgi:hypothetical protein